MLTIKKPDSHFQVIHVPEEVKRLDEIKINDKLTITYLEASRSICRKEEQPRARRA